MTIDWTAGEAGSIAGQLSTVVLPSWQGGAAGGGEGGSENEVKESGVREPSGKASRVEDKERRGDAHGGVDEAGRVVSAWVRL